MTPAPQMFYPVVGELSSTVDRLVESASWSGAAANAMRAKWTRNALETAEVGTFIGAVGDTLGQLGDGLFDVESALYNSADACRRRGAQIDDSNGKPLSLVIKGDPHSPEAQAAVGVGDGVHQAFHEHWREDIHDSGVVGGVGQGMRNTGSRVVADAGAMLEEGGHMASGAAKSVWHGIFGSGN
jgi:hypothetical protein